MTIALQPNLTFMFVSGLPFSCLLSIPNLNNMAPRRNHRFISSSKGCT